MESVKSPDTNSAVTSSKRATDLLLVKDLQADRIVYYWTDIEGAIISPLLASLIRADEWRKVYLHENYLGQQRRSSTIDRRRYAHKRELHSGAVNVSPLFKRGRRAEDQAIRVDCDLAEAKLNALLAPHKNAAEAEQRKKQR